MATRLMANHLYTTGPGCPGCENICNYTVPCNYRLHCNSAQEAQHKTRRVPHMVSHLFMVPNGTGSVCSGGSWSWPPFFFFFCLEKLVLKPLEMEDIDVESFTEELEED